MSDPIFKVLFICTGNSARSILAESILNHLGAGRFAAFSAGSRPKGAVNPVALRLLQDAELPTEGLRSKSWDEFSEPGSPQFDFIITVCDNAAGETCPVWPGHPVTAHWGIADPAAATGSDEQRIQAFRKAFIELETRIKLFISLPLRALDRISRKGHLDAIGKSQTTDEAATAS
jgi:arsenate reductase (thioredoxin)